MTELQRQRQKYVAILPWYDRVLGVETTFSLEKWKSTRALVIAITVLCLVVTVAVNLNGLRLSAQDADSEYRNGVTALARSDYSGAIHFLQRQAVRANSTAERTMKALGHNPSTLADRCRTRLQDA